MEVKNNRGSRTIDFSSLPWSDHPFIAGVETRSVQTEIRGHSAEDAMIIRLKPGEVAPWHTHDGSCETAWVIAGRGVLVTRESSREVAHPLQAETAILVPAGLTHKVENDGDESLLIFAIHSTVEGRKDGE